MKKNEKYFAVNNQEDEDGDSLYPPGHMTNKRINWKQDIVSQKKKPPIRELAFPDQGYTALVFQPLRSRSEVMKNKIISERR
ncbi:MAG: hypothetical protein ABI675_06405 [Chitinophagaceae bacterium]